MPIRVKVRNEWNYEFYVDEDETLMHDNRLCPYCRSTYLDSVYCYIIDNLKEAGLLHEDFEEICCCCLILQHFGLMDLRDKLIGFVYSEKLDYLLIEFNCWEMAGKESILDIYIRNWSKIKMF